MPKISAEVRSAMERRRSARLQSKDLSPAGRPRDAIVCKEEKLSPSGPTSKGDVKRSATHTPSANTDKKVAVNGEPGTPRTRHKIAPVDRGDTGSPMVHGDSLKDIADEDLAVNTTSDSDRSDMGRSDSGVVAAKNRKCKLHKKGKVGTKQKKGSGVHVSPKVSTPRKEARDPTHAIDTVDTPRSRAGNSQARRKSPKAQSLPGTPTLGNKHRSATTHRKRTSSSGAKTETPSSDEKHQSYVKETSTNVRPHHSRKLAKALLDDDFKRADLKGKCTAGDSCSKQCSVVLQTHMYAEQPKGCRSTQNDVLCRFDAAVKSETPLDGDTKFKRKPTTIDYTQVRTTGVKSEQPATKQNAQPGDWLGTTQSTDLSPRRNEDTTSGQVRESLVSDDQHDKFVVATMADCRTDNGYPTSDTNTRNLLLTPPQANEPPLGEHQGDTGTQKVLPAATCWVNATGDSELCPTRGSALGKTDSPLQPPKNELHTVKSANAMSAMIPNPFTIQHGLQQTFDFAAFQPVSPPSRRDMLDADFSSDLQVSHTV